MKLIDKAKALEAIREAMKHSYRWSNNEDISIGYLEGLKAAEKIIDNLELETSNE